eukprot:197936-Chlamydomonas_euryale.AAC.1
MSGSAGERAGGGAGMRMSGPAGEWAEKRTVESGQRSVDVCMCVRGGVLQFHEKLTSCTDGRMGTRRQDNDVLWGQSPTTCCTEGPGLGFRVEGFG